MAERIIFSFPFIFLPHRKGALYPTKQRKEMNASCSYHQISCRPRYVITELFTLLLKVTRWLVRYTLENHVIVLVISTIFTRTFSIVVKILNTVHYVSEANCFLLQVSSVLSIFMTMEKSSCKYNSCTTTVKVYMLQAVFVLKSVKCGEIIGRMPLLINTCVQQER